MNRRHSKNFTKKLIPWKNPSPKTTARRKTKPQEKKLEHAKKNYVSSTDSEKPLSGTKSRRNKQLTSNFNKGLNKRRP